MSLAGTISIFLLLASAAMALVRLARGVSVADRIVALDVTLTLLAGGIGVWAADTERAVFLDVMIVIALIAFIGTITAARLIERRGTR